MEPLFTLLLQSAAAFGNAALSKVAESAVSDAWAAVKNAITRKRPDVLDAAKMIEDLRAAPTSPQVTKIVQRLEQLDISRDTEIAGAIRSLIETLESAGGTTHVNAPTAQNVYGDQVSHGPSTRTYNLPKGN